MENKRKTGGRYEQIAAEFLRQNGFRILEQNFFTRFGEIDIVAREQDYLCFVEVKYRTGYKYGYAAEAVNYTKQRTICRVAMVYMKARRLAPTTPVRFDVVTIQGDDIRLFRNAFSFR